MRSVLTRGKCDSGFTLIELSIVLVIIGLLAGGVLVGRELIEASKNRSQARQLEELSAATKTFRMKFGALPGDIPNPATFGLYAGYPGDNNGMINDFGNAPPVTALHSEARFFFLHLSQAGLVADQFANYAYSYSYCDPETTGGVPRQAPPLKVGSGGIVASTYLGKLWWYLGLNNCKISNVPVASYAVSAWSTGGVMTPGQAYYLDSKLDDGKPGSGSILAVTHTNGTLDTTDGNCVANTASSYNLTANTVECRLYVRAQ